LVLVRFVAAAAIALVAAFWQHMRHALDGNDWRLPPETRRHVFTLRQLLLWQAVLAIVLTGWMVHGRGKVLGNYRSLANQAREHEATALFERYGWGVQVPNYEPGRGELRLMYLGRGPQPEVTDATLKQITDFGRVRVLLVHSDQITDEGLAALATVPELTILSVRGRQITDEGVRALARLPNLEQLTIHSPLLTDAALAHLAEVPRLKVLSISGPENLTAEGEAKFRAAQPSTKLYCHLPRQK
jgi:hypothetical protein